MDEREKIEVFYSRDHPFREGINLLRKAVLKSPVTERLKWGAPVYTVKGKNVLGIMAFKNHFGLWFFNGVFLKDPHKVLESAQEKTRGMRHLRYRSVEEVDLDIVEAYVGEAVENQLRGLEIAPEKKKTTTIPERLQRALDQDESLKEKFGAFTPYKQREFCEYITSAKRENTKDSRLQKILPMIEKGIGLSDKYRK